MPSGECQFIYEPTLDGYKLQFDYQGWNKQHRDFIAVLKGIIPSSDREYKPGWTDPVTHEVHKPLWFISTKSHNGTKDYYKILEHLIDVTFYPVFKYSKEQSSQYQYGSIGGIKVSVNDEINKFNKIVVELGLSQLNDKTEQNEATKIYRKAALLLHPDRNQGNGEKMSILNEVWNNIKKEKYANKLTESPTTMGATT